MQGKIRDLGAETNPPAHPILLQQVLHPPKEAPVAIQDASATMAEGGVKAFLALVACLILVACERDQVVQTTFKEFTSGEWHADSVVQFHYDRSGAPELMELAIHLQHDASYPYANLFLFRKVLID